MKKLFSVILVFLFLCNSTSLLAQNWWEWKVPISTDYVNMLCLDKQNNSIVVGKGIDGYTRWMYKYNRDGILLWKKTTSSYNYDIAVDDFGNIYATGDHQSFPTEEENIRKFDANGVKLWGINFRTNFGYNNVVGYKIYPSQNGDIYVAGVYAAQINSYPQSDTIKLGNLSTPYKYYGQTSNSHNIVIAKINAHGVPQWLKSFACSNSDVSGNFFYSPPHFYSVIEDDSHHLFISGDFCRGSLLLDTTMLTSVNYVPYLMQLKTENGQVQWAKKLAQNDGVPINGLGVTWPCYLALSFSNGVVASYNVLGSFDTSGNQRWVRSTPAFTENLQKGNNQYYANTLTDSVVVFDSSGYQIKKVFAKAVSKLVLSKTDETIIAIGNSSTTGSYFICKYLEGKNKVSGYAYKDDNNNGIKDSTEKGIAGMLMGELPNKYIAITNSDGYYECNIDTGSHTIMPLRGIQYNSVSPSAGYSLSFTRSGDTATGKNFAFSAIPGINDILVLLSPESPARPGFKAYCYLTVKNRGTVNATGIASVKLPAEISYFADAYNDSTVYNASDSVAFAFSNLQPGQDKSFRFMCQVSPFISIGDTVVFHAFASPAINDTVPSDNYDTLWQRVRGSYDPNDKQVFPDGDIDYTKKDKPLNYIIRFQNTGNDTAFNIHLIDSLSAKLDISSLEFLSSSHPYSAKIDKNNVLHFYFDNINLVDSTHNEPMSHGFVRFSIKPTSTVTLGDTIHNTGYIYFDYNAAVVTNTTNTRYISNTLPVMLMSFSAQKSNGTSLLNFSLAENISFGNIEIERSTDAVSFTKIGSIATAAHFINYNFTDKAPVKGINFYRLKLIMTDGSFKYSDTKALQFNTDKAPAFDVFPNPAVQSLFFTTGVNGKASYKIINTAGQALMSGSTEFSQGNTIGSINVSELRTGIYYLQVTSAAGLSTKKIIIEKQ